MTLVCKGKGIFDLLAFERDVGDEDFAGVLVEAPGGTARHGTAEERLNRQRRRIDLQPYSRLAITT